MKKLTILLCFVIFSCLYPRDNQISKEEGAYIVFKADDDKFFSRNYKLPFIDEEVHQYEVFVDGMYVGRLYDYEDKSLKVVSGTHLIEIKYGEDPVLHKRIFVSSGKTREIAID